ncbi:MAG: Smr/MutS family protein [Parvibaculum sp.]
MAVSGMADDKEKKVPRRRSRNLTDDERKLWRVVVKDATPLARKRILRPEDLEGEEAPAPPAALPSLPAYTPPKPLAAPQAPRRPAEPPPLTGLDRRTSQRLARGQMEVEATLDLHGHSQTEAHGRLLGFLAGARSRGLRCVLVITGKGASPYARHTLHGASFYEVPERQGVLRSAVPRWLNEADFRALVSGFQPAHPKHGGGGAFYIWLRKKR